MKPVTLLRRNRPGAKGPVADLFVTPRQGSSRIASPSLLDLVRLTSPFRKRYRIDQRQY